MSIVCTLMPLACHMYVTRMYSYSFVCHFCVFINHPCALVYHSYVSGMSLVCTCVSFVCHSNVLVCHLYVTRMNSYVTRMSLLCGFTMNLLASVLQGFSKSATNTSSFRRSSKLVHSYRILTGVSWKGYQILFKVCFLGSKSKTQDKTPSKQIAFTCM